MWNLLYVQFLENLVRVSIVEISGTKLVLIQALELECYFDDKSD